MNYTPIQFALLGTPQQALTRSERSSIAALARILDPGACHSAPHDAIYLDSRPRLAWHPRKWRPQEVWPLPPRARGYLGEQVGAACRIAGVDLLLHEETLQSFLSGRTYGDEARAIARAYCLLGFLPPYAALARLLQEPPDAAVPLGVDLLLVGAGQRSLARVQTDARLLQHALEESRSGGRASSFHPER